MASRSPCADLKSNALRSQLRQDCGTKTRSVGKRGQNISTVPDASHLKRCLLLSALGSVFSDTAFPEAGMLAILGRGTTRRVFSIRVVQ